MAEDKNEREKKEKPKEENVKKVPKEEKKQPEEEKSKEKTEEKKEVLPKPKKKFGKAKIKDAKISLKDSKIICGQLRNKRVSKSKSMLQDMIDRKRNLNRKYYTNAVKKILEVLTNAEANAVEHQLDQERLFIYTIKADKGRTFYRPRSGLRRRGERAKMTHIEITVGEK